MSQGRKARGGPRTGDAAGFGSNDPSDGWHFFGTVASVERSVTASAVVDLAVVRARQLLVDDPSGLLLGGAPAQDVSFEVGAPETDGWHVVVPVRATAEHPGGVHLLDARLGMRDHPVGSLVHLHGCYAAVLGGTFADGLRAHRDVRRFAQDLVDGVAARLLERAFAL